MILMTNTSVSFIRVADQWYAKHIPSDSTVFMVGTYGEHGGCTWEFAITDGEAGVSSPRVKIFMDAFVAFQEIPEFFAGLAELGDAAMAEDIMELMLELGFKDRTQEVAPA